MRWRGWWVYSLCSTWPSHLLSIFYMTKISRDKYRKTGFILMLAACVSFLAVNLAYWPVLITGYGEPPVLSGIVIALFFASIPFCHSLDYLFYPTGREHNCFRNIYCNAGVLDFRSFLRFCPYKSNACIWRHTFSYSLFKRRNFYSHIFGSHWKIDGIIF